MHATPSHSLSPLLRGEGGVRGRGRRAKRTGATTSSTRSSTSFFQLRKDHRQNTVSIGRHVRIPEAEDTIAVRPEHLVTHPVSHTVGVLASIHFDDELLIPASKIHDEGSDCFLADKFKSAQPTVTQREPQFGLGIGGLSSQTSLKANGRSLRSAHASAPHPNPYPNPLPASGEREHTTLAAMYVPPHATSRRHARVIQIPLERWRQSLIEQNARLVSERAQLRNVGTAPRRAAREHG